MCVCVCFVFWLKDDISSSTLDVVQIHFVGKASVSMTHVQNSNLDEKSARSWKKRTKHNFLARTSSASKPAKLAGCKAEGKNNCAARGKHVKLTLQVINHYLLSKC